MKYAFAVVMVAVLGASPAETDEALEQMGKALERGRALVEAERFDAATGELGDLAAVVRKDYGAALSEEAAAVLDASVKRAEALDDPAAQAWTLRSGLEVAQLSLAAASAEGDARSK